MGTGAINGDGRWAGGQSEAGRQDGRMAGWQDGRRSIARNGNKKREEEEEEEEEKKKKKMDLGLSALIGLPD